MAAAPRVISSRGKDTLKARARRGEGSSYKGPVARVIRSSVGSGAMATTAAQPSPISTKGTFVRITMRDQRKSRHGVLVTRESPTTRVRNNNSEAHET